MTGRDRIVVIGVAVLVILGAAWLMVVSPERQQASKLDAQVASAQSSLSEAEGKLASARTAQTQYATAYASVVNLGKAVPPSQEVPSLIYQLAQASNQKSVEFASIVSGSSTGSGSSSSSTAASGAAAGGFTQLPFTFVFEGSFFDLEHLFQKLTGFTTSTGSGNLQVSGRLLTIQSVKLSPSASAATGNGPKALTGTITASAYVLPANQGLTGSATAASPTGAGASPASTTASASSPTPAAIVKVNP